jgi:hypothetical protein
VALTNITTTTKAGQEETASPHLTFSLHPDGLGWQVHVTQETMTTLITTGEERRSYRTFDFSGRASKSLDSNYDDLCAVAMLFTPLFSPFDLEHPPFWVKWDRFSSTCNRSAESNSSTKNVRVGTLRAYTEHSVKAVTTGSLALSWQPEHGAPIQVLIPLESNTTTHGLSVRLRWLAEVMQRNGYSLRHAGAGSVSVRLIRQGRVLDTRTPSLPANALADSLKDDRAVSTPAEHWPRPLVVAVSSSTSLASDEHIRILPRLAHTLTRLAVPLIARGSDWDEIRSELAKAHHPAFTGTAIQDPARTAGATILLHVDIHSSYAQSRILTFTLTRIDTGEILGQITAGGHDSQWPFIIETATGQLLHMLEPLASQTRPTLTHGDGTP